MASRRHSRGQSTAEYAIVVGIVIAAVVGMQLYLKRGLQAKMKGVSDHMASVTGSAVAGAIGGTGGVGATPIAGGMVQYEPYYNPAQSGVVVVSDRNTTETILSDGTGKTTYNDETNRAGGTQTQGADPGPAVHWNSSSY